MKFRLIWLLWSVYMIAWVCATQHSPSARSDIASFKVMDVLKSANDMEAAGGKVYHLEVGQPGTGAPKRVLDAAAKAVRNHLIGYTSTQGILPLRERIAKRYKTKYGVDIPASRVIITTGSSAAFVFAFLGCFDVGDHVAIASSGYPCYRNILSATGINVVSISTNSEFKITAKEIADEIRHREAHELPKLKGLILSSPGNPTGAMLTPDEVRDLTKLCIENDIYYISDEIYHGITYGKKDASALEYSSEDVIVINSFSKYYSMTGWRLGWMIVPESLVDVMIRLGQNMYINAPTLSQVAAIEAFDCEDELQGHLKVYTANREIVLECLKELDLLDCCSPADGAFYMYLDLKSKGVTDSPKLCQRILEESGVAVVPGVDFEDPSSGLGLQRIRLSFCRSTHEIEEGMSKFKAWWKANMQ